VSLNKAMIIGNLGRDPEMRYTASGQAVTQFTVAVNRNFRGPDGNWQEETEWFRVVAWGPLAERTAERLRKGNKVYVEGRLQTHEWQDKEGQKRYTTELIAQTVTPLDPRPRDAEGGFEGSFPGRAARGGPAGESAPDGAPAVRAPRREPSGPPADTEYSDLDDLPF
jgi:single-strand DNA-binding protein